MIFPAAESPRNRRQRRVAEQKAAAARSASGREIDDEVREPENRRGPISPRIEQKMIGAGHSARSLARGREGRERTHWMPGDPASVTRNAAFECAFIGAALARSLFTSRGAQRLALSDRLFSGCCPAAGRKGWISSRPLGSSDGSRFDESERDRLARTENATSGSELLNSSRIRQRAFVYTRAVARETSILIRRLRDHACEESRRNMPPMRSTFQSP
jgi:hypothetical protein